MCYYVFKEVLPTCISRLVVDLFRSLLEFDCLIKCKLMNKKSIQFNWTFCFLSKVFKCFTLFLLISSFVEKITSFWIIKVEILGVYC